MSLTHEGSGRYPVEEAEAAPVLGNRVHRGWQRYENSPLPLGLKWSLSIAALIVTAMGVLGSYLIQQQENGYRNQVDRFS
ncbi:MAG: hypothetical protein WBM63_19370, partial [Sedimenticolaceae bacterium]